ncbi:unnamed protein product [Ceutorhynchus assimilis]|uniref:Uncharacterized protein n=1 Tax=Ceutorhynchus assimilis TaxID=467358 RepID=A0A9N9MZY4_9CUCU|nr:unnamed protein product [Ceutorhynchus assimilis]
MAAVGRVRNMGCIPFLDEEGEFTKPIAIVECRKDSCYDSAKSPSQRMYMHQTLASARRYVHFKPFDNLVPKDDLDLVLGSTYNQSTEVFAEKVDAVLQPETRDIKTWRRLRNTRDLTPDREQMAASKVLAQESRQRKRTTVPFRYNFAHKVLIGGVLEHKHPSSIKLMNSSHHAPQTNAGYSRQPSDGNFYQY